MKINIDINGDLWKSFREKVHASGKTLAEVTPTVLEPALRCYVETMPLVEQCSSGCGCTTSAAEEKHDVLPAELPIIDRVITPAPVPQTITAKRCELCDMPTERLHMTSAGKRVCYNCWKSAVTQ